jgi:hypothetical protein
MGHGLLNIPNNGRVLDARAFITSAVDHTKQHRDYLCPARIVFLRENTVKRAKPDPKVVLSA